MKVSDIMTKEVISVRPGDKIVDVAEILQANGFNGVPVVENSNVFGMITEDDLVSHGATTLHIPSLIKIFQDLKVEKYMRGWKGEEYHNFLEAKADSVMNPDCVTVSPETEIAELIDIFHEKHVNPVPVVDGEGKLVGIVSLSDIVKLVSEFREEEINFINSTRNADKS